MAIKRPIADYDGTKEELRTGDTVYGATAQAMATAANANASSITKGQPVYMTSDGEVDLCQANASGTTVLFGVVADTSVATTANANIQLDGVLDATTAEWDAIAGTTGGLVPGTQYIVSPTVAGNLVANNTALTAGQWHVPVLLAKSATEALIVRGERLKKN